MRHNFRLIILLIITMSVLFVSCCDIEQNGTAASEESDNYFSDTTAFNKETTSAEEDSMYDIDSVQKKDIDKKISELPKGKSFIYITDQHFPSCDFNSAETVTHLIL